MRWCETGLSLVKGGPSPPHPFWKGVLATPHPVRHPHRWHCHCSRGRGVTERGGGGGGDGGGEEEGGKCLVKAQSKEGRQVGGEGRSVLFVFFLFRFLIYLGGEERENKFPLRWRRAKSPPHGSRCHAHARLHAGRSRLARWPNSVEIVSSELDCRGAFFFFFFWMRQSYRLSHMQVWE